MSDTCNTGPVEDRPGRPGAPAAERAQPAYRQLADRLLALIVSGALRPGDRLPSESELGAQFGVSRSTVREALRALSSRDLVTTTRGTAGGTFVNRMQAKQVSEYLESSLGLMSGGDLGLQEILEARELLEVPAAGLAAARRTDEHLAQLQHLAAADHGHRERGVSFTENRDFHQAVLAAAQNTLVGLMTEPVFGILQGRLLEPSLDAAAWEAVSTDHQLITDRVAAGDVPGAQDAMRGHLQRLRRFYVP